MNPAMNPAINPAVIRCISAVLRDGASFTAQGAVPLLSISAGFGGANCVIAVNGAPP